MPNELLFYGELGTDVTAQDIKTQLAQMDQNEELVGRFDSPGGSVFQGFAIYEAIKNYPGPKRAIIESSAFSIASYIAMAFDAIEVASNGYLMIHNPSVTSDGDDEAHARDASLLAKLKASMVEAYSAKSGISSDEVLALMKAESYFNASESVSRGFATRVLSAPVQSRIVAMKNHLPQRVCASLFSGGPSGDANPPKEKPMADNNVPVAATVADIKAAFPKAKSDFIVRCLEKQMPIASVAAAAADELMKENEELQAKIAAMEEEMAAAKAKAMEEEESAKAAEEEEMEAKAKAKGHTPVAVGSHGKASSIDKWSTAIESCLAKCNGNRQRAVAMANRQNPGLRSAMLTEVNGRR